MTTIRDRLRALFASEAVRIAKEKRLLEAALKEAGIPRTLARRGVSVYFEKCLENRR